MTEIRSTHRLKGGFTAWTGIRSLGNSAFARLSIYVPIVGYFLIFNDNIISYLRLHSEFCQNNGCEAGWRIYFIYFGLTSSAVASVIYAIFCPNVIKMYATSREFFNSNKEFYCHPDSLSWLLDDIRLQSGEKYRLSTHFDSLIQSDSTVGPGQVNVLSGPMSAFFNLSNYDRKKWRISSLTFYVVGLILLMIPSVFTFLQVVVIALGRAALWCAA